MIINSIIEKPLNAAQCTTCQTISYPKRSFCPKCKGTVFTSFKLPKKGKIYSFTTVHYPLSKYDKPPYHVGLITFDEINLTITARISPGKSEMISIDQPVQLSITKFFESGSLPIVIAKILENES